MPGQRPGGKGGRVMKEAGCRAGGASDGSAVRGRARVAFQSLGARAVRKEGHDV